MHSEYAHCIRSCRCRHAAILGLLDRRTARALDLSFLKGRPVRAVRRLRKYEDLPRSWKEGVFSKTPSLVTPSPGRLSPEAAAWRRRPRSGLDKRHFFRPCTSERSEVVHPAPRQRSVAASITVASYGPPSVLKPIPENYLGACAAPEERKRHAAAMPLQWDERLLFSLT